MKHGKCLVHKKPSRHGLIESPAAAPTPVSSEGPPSVGLGLEQDITSATTPPGPSSSPGLLEATLAC